MLALWKIKLSYYNMCGKTCDIWKRLEATREDYEQRDLIEKIPTIKVVWFNLETFLEMFFMMCSTSTYVFQEYEKVQSHKSMGRSEKCFISS